jgi:hypothetical protein
VLFSGAYGGNHIIMLLVIQIGRAYSKKGRLFPNFPGFLLSIMTPKIMEKKAEINTLNESPTEARTESRLIVYT